MKSLSRLLLVAALLFAVAAVPGLSTAASTSTSIDNPQPLPVQPEPIASTCGYSSGGLENAESDAENNANLYCINMGCQSATITTTYEPWTDKDGYTHICVSFACNCAVIAAPAK